MKIRLTPELIERTTSRHQAQSEGRYGDGDFLPTGFCCVMAEAVCGALGVRPEDRRVFVSHDAITLDTKWAAGPTIHRAKLDNPPEVKAVVAAFDHDEDIPAMTLDLPIDHWRELL